MKIYKITLRNKKEKGAAYAPFPFVAKTLPICIKI